MDLEVADPETEMTFVTLDFPVGRGGKLLVCFQGGLWQLRSELRRCKMNLQGRTTLNFQILFLLKQSMLWTKGACRSRGEGHQQFDW